MLGIGWVMFGKAIVVAVWVVIVERWQAYRRRRRQDGLPLKYSRKHGIYVVSDWTANVDRGAVWMRNSAYAIGFILWTILGGAYLFGFTDQLRDGLVWLLTA